MGEGNPAQAQAFQKFAPFPLKLPPPSLCLPEWHFRFGIKALRSVPTVQEGGEEECPFPGLCGRDMEDRTHWAGYDWGVLCIGEQTLLG